MAFLVIEVDDFLVAATDDFLVTEDDTAPGTGFDSVNLGATPAAAARLGAQVLSLGRLGSAIIWDASAIFTGPAPADLSISGFAPTLPVPEPAIVYPASAALSLSGLVPVVSDGSAVMTYMAPGGISLTSMATGADLMFSDGGNGFVLNR